MAEDRTRELVTAASRGDRPAIDELVARHLPRLHAYVRIRMGRTLRTREGSMDVVQSVCRELCSHLGEFEYRDEQQFLGWLFTTAMRKLMEKQRFHERQVRAPEREVADAGELDPLHLLTPSRTAASAEELTRIAAALDGLSDEHREVIGLARIAGLGFREIGDRMGRSEAAARKLLGRALLALSTALGDDQTLP